MGRGGRQSSRSCRPGRSAYARPLPVALPWQEPHPVSVPTTRTTSVPAWAGMTTCLRRDNGGADAYVPPRQLRSQSRPRASSALAITSGGRL